MGRDCFAPVGLHGLLFQSTLPAWGETRRGHDRHRPEPISIHSPRMGRDLDKKRAMLLQIISIHSPRMGRDHADAVQQPRHPLISIHSPRMGRDAGLHQSAERAADFNPLSPHGERLQYAGQLMATKQFQSTLPAWGETRSWKKIL